MRPRKDLQETGIGLRIYVARGEQVRCLTLTPGLLAAFCTACLLLAVWLVGSTAYLVFHQEIREASTHYLVAKQRASEDRIAELRRQIDELNGRQFLNQVAFEDRLETVRRRQRALDQRQTQIDGLLEALGSREGNFERSASSGEEKRAEATRINTGSTWSPFLAGRPRPGSLAEARQATPRSPDGALSALDRSADQLWNRQQENLTALESDLLSTIDKLASVPKAIGAPLPKLEAEGAGVGGPFVELRGNDQPVTIDDQIDRIERAMTRLETLQRHVRRLPVRVPLESNARITSGYGSRVDPFLGRRAMHTGIDFRASTGTPVRATAAGQVTRAGRLGGYGNLIEIDHGDGYATRYAHLSRIDVRRGQSVAPGDVIGAAGSTGRSTGPHLHYETWVNGRAVNPEPFVKASDLLPADS